MNDDLPLDGFEVFVTTDSRLRYQQDLASRRIAIICLLSTSWPRIQRTVGTVVGAISACSPASYTEVPSATANPTAVEVKLLLRE